MNQSESAGIVHCWEKLLAAWEPASAMEAGQLLAAGTLFKDAREAGLEARGDALVSHYDTAVVDRQGDEVIAQLALKVAALIIGLHASVVVQKSSRRSGLGV